MDIETKVFKCNSIIILKSICIRSLAIFMILLLLFTIEEKTNLLIMFLSALLISTSYVIIFKTGTVIIDKTRVILKRPLRPGIAVNKKRSQFYITKEKAKSYITICDIIDDKYYENCYQLPYFSKDILDMITNILCSPKNLK